MKHLLLHLHLLLLVLAALAGCTGNSSQAAPTRSAPGKLEAIGDALCVTKGSAAIKGAVTEPTVRAVAPSTSGEAAALTFTYRGYSTTKRELASGQERHQLGLKLRAQDGCNLVYVMWRLESKKGIPIVEVSVKRNPGQRTSEQCGTDGYTKVKPAKDHTLALVPVLAAGDTHTLRAAIAGDELRAWIDDKLVWRGTLPDSTRDLAGPAGLRSDNLAYDLVAFAAAAGDGKAKCTKEDGD
jgi:hypothetical protein